MNTETGPPLTTPFKNIALAFSGGGFRAAAFSLGTLSYLKHLKLDFDEYGNPTDKSLLDNVTFISSASGGTITASVYSMWRNKKESFGTIYKKILTALHGDQLLNKALEKLNDDQEWTQNRNLKRRNLINAFAKAYDEQLFQGEKFGIYWNEDGLRNFEVCFNTTEFRRGLPFRFQTDGDATTNELIGNKYIHFDKNHSTAYKNIKLADILAASSCFPSGFEPIVFPEDFSYNGIDNLTADELRQALLVENYNKAKTALDPTERIGLMDGGITDNQGLHSTMVADNRRRENSQKEFDLIIVTDVASYYMTAYKVPEEKKDDSWKKSTLNDCMKKLIKIPRILKIIFIVSLLFMLASVLLILFANRLYIHHIGYFTLGLFTSIVLILLIIDYLKKRFGLTKILDPEFDIKESLKKVAPPIKHFSDSIIDKLITFLKDTRLGVLQQMVSARISSVLTMVSDVNLKHVRRLIYNEFYTTNSKWENRQCPNFIYELSKQNENSRRENLNKHVKDKTLAAQNVETLQASSKILDVAEQARLVGTTLWFEQNNEKLKEVVACGQFSTCVNLLQYIFQLENASALQLSELVKKMLVSIKEKLIADWKQFNDNPCFLFELYEK